MKLLPQLWLRPKLSLSLIEGTQCDIMLRWSTYFSVLLEPAAARRQAVAGQWRGCGSGEQ